MMQVVYQGSLSWASKEIKYKRTFDVEGTSRQEESGRTNAHISPKPGSASVWRVTKMSDFLRTAENRDW